MNWFMVGHIILLIMSYYLVLLMLSNFELVFSSLHLFTIFVIYLPTNCSLTLNGGVASIIAWLDHSNQKTEIGDKISKGILPIEKFCCNKSPREK